MCSIDAEFGAEAGDMPDTQAPPVVEVDDLGTLTEAQHVRANHPVVLAEPAGGTLPTQFGPGAALAAVQPNDQVPDAGIQVAGGQTVDVDGSAYEVHGHTILMFSELENIILQIAR